MMGDSAVFGAGPGILSCEFEARVVAPQHLINTRLAIRLRTGLACLAILCAAGFCGAEERALERWSFGWDGVVTVGRWIPATVEFTLTAAAECRLELSALDAEGHTATFVSPVTSLLAGEQRLTAFFQCGRLDSFVRGRLVTDETPHDAALFRPGQTDHLRPLAKLSDRLFVAAGLPLSKGFPLGFDQIPRTGRSAGDAAIHAFARSDPSRLPTDPQSYDSIECLVLAGENAVSPDVSEAIRHWVADGGRLVISIPKNLTAFRESPVRTWLPVQVDNEPIAVLNLGELEALAGRSIRIPTTGRQFVARLRLAEGVTLASSRDDPLLVRAPYGFGEVTVLALDITQPPLKNWGGLPGFTRNLLEVPAETPNAAAKATHRIGQLTSTGISDLASQLQAGLDQFPAVDRASPWWSMVWLLGLLAAVGPIDYLLVHRVLRRPQATWLTLPVWLIVAGTVAARSSQAWNTSAAQWNQLDLVDIDAGSGQYRAQSWGTLYSPETARQNLAVSGPAGVWSQLVATSAATHPRLSWFASPETAFGGMYRPAGTEWDRTEYRVFADRQRMEGLPALQWSSRTITAEWSGAGNSPVASTLQGSGLGRLTGSVTHHLPGELTDWILAYGNRAFRRQPDREQEVSTPWPAGQTWSLDDPNTFQLELRGVLTRSIVHRDKESASGYSVRTEQSRYDPLGRDLLTTCEILTFHEAAGGAAYSTLANHLLADRDLSRQLNLGRAVLFGKLSAPRLATVERNGANATPTQHDVFVRIVLPVRRGGEFVRELPKLDQKK